MAATELAVCLPPVILLVVASIECTNMIFVDHSLSIAAYEAARHAGAKQATSSDVESRCNEILTGRRIAGTTVTLTPSDITSAVPGQQVTVTVSAGCAENASLFPMWFFNGHRMTSSVTMVRED